MITDLFEPYSRALADLVDERLDATGRAVILDVHSFPRDPLPYELFPHAERPEICLGTDERHTPAGLLKAVRQGLARLGGVAINQLFGGSYVPLRHNGRDDRVSSIMLEIRRDAYLRDDGNPDTLALDGIATAAAGLIDNWKGN